MYINFHQSSIILELAAAVVLFLHSYEKKKRFGVRAVGCLLALVMLSSVKIFENDNRVLDFVGYVLYYMLIAIGIIWSIYFCWKMRKMEAVVIGVIAYTTQHCASDLFMLLVDSIGLEIGKILFGPLHYILLLIAFALVYGVLYATFWKQFCKVKEKIIERYQWVMVSAGILAFVIVLNLVAFQYTSERAVRIVCGIYDIIGTLFSLVVLLYLAKNDYLYSDVDSLSQMLKMKQENYDMWKENIDMINIKAHDIRQQLSSFSNEHATVFTEKLAGQIEENIRVYDSITKTGNEALDVALTEKKMYCDQNNIKLFCMADGSRMSFMDNVDIYCIFSNILQNGIEAVQALSNPEKRIINLNVFTKGNLLCVQEENYFHGELTLENGLPVTTKEDKQYHGFGTRSIDMLVKKYGGELVIQNDEDIFSLSIMIPWQKINKITVRQY